MIRQIYREKPSVLKSSLSLLMHRPKLKPDLELPDIELCWSLPCIDLAGLNSYQELCAYAIDDRVPLCYPYVLCGPLHLQLMTRLPIPAMGLLHLTSEISLIESIDLQSPIELICRSGMSKVTPQGLEFEAVSILEQAGKEKWRCTATFLKRGTFSNAIESDSPLLTKLDFSDPIGGFTIPRNIGRRYARLCGDYNPIHISKPSAWLFGLKGSIAHGMWVGARALSLISEKVNHLELAFKGPVFTGGHVDLVRKGDDFNLFYRGNDRPVILGRVKD